MDHTHQHGKPVSILRFSGCKEIIVDNRQLENIFNHPEIQDRKVVILSLIGAFRGGKSFFLDYCLRFLYAHFPSINNPSKQTQTFFRKDDNWIGKPDEPLKGFSWRAGTKRETVGINIWSDVFLHTLNGENIAIFVMDTQGLFDRDSSPTDNSRIFALGTLISSIQVLNLNHQVQEDQLQYLQFATEFAQYTLKNKGKMDGKPFQNLTFLIRDWQNCHEFEYGPYGGKRYFEDEVLKIRPSQGSELQTVREYIKNSFDQIGCCLLPYPGTDVATSPQFDGRLTQMDEKFKIELKNVIEHLLMPDNLTLKKLNSQKLTVKQVKVYIEQYLKIFQSGDVPKALTVFQSMLESNMNSLIKDCIDKYKTGIFYDKNLKNLESIPIVHKKWKYEALKFYNDSKKIGDKQHEEIYKAQLDNKLEVVYSEFKNIHEQRFKELKKKEDECHAKVEQERKIKKQAEQQRAKLEADLKAAQERMTRDIKRAAEESERKLNEIRKKHDDECAAIQQRLDEEKNSFGHYAGKVVSGAGLVVATPFVVVGSEVATVYSMVKGAIQDGREGFDKQGRETFEATFGAFGNAWKEWWES
ncbi:unnamed protein product [Chironomus riparius]|uniref:GB1/RHD3-type G domain-containing protein n=1 Tax=Chironomus riparius TaxID=315576 RepID=A0A9N9S8M1_9DIPT|nr:unnamed protein product [Chironomus riparius]